MSLEREKIIINKNNYNLKLIKIMKIKYFFSGIIEVYIMLKNNESSE